MGSYASSINNFISMLISKRSTFEHNFGKDKLNKMKILSIFLTIILHLILSQMGLGADLIGSPQLQKKIFQTKQMMDEGRSALLFGLPTLAQNCFLKVLDSDLSSFRTQATLGLMDAYIATQDFAQAQYYLNTLKETKNSSILLRKALIAYGQNQDIRQPLADCYPDGLDQQEKVFYYFLQAVEKMEAGLPNAAESLFILAQDHSVSAAQKAWIEGGLAQARRKQLKLDDADYENLKLKAESYKNQPMGIIFTQEYALALAQRGNITQALQILEKELKNRRIKNVDQESDLLLLMSQISEGTPQQENILKKMLEPKYGLETQKKALYGLIKNQSVEIAQRFISSLIHGQVQPELLFNLYILRSQIYLTQNNWAQAQQDAEQALALNHQSSEPLELLYRLAWEKNQFKVAANYAAQARSYAISTLEKTKLTTWIADAYFMAEDFEQAALLYQEALDQAPKSMESILVYQATLSLIQMNQLQAAEHILNSYPLENEINWQAQWNLTQAFRANNQIDHAKQRLKHIQRHANDPHLAYRLDWLEAQLALDNESYLETIDLVHHLITKIKTLPPSVSEKEWVELIYAEALLLQAEAMVKLNRFDEAKSTFEQLRSECPNQPAAIRSLLMEARYQAAIDHLVEAQQKYIELIHTYADSPYAPIALYENALIASQRGTPQAKQDSIHLLEKLIIDYPNHELVRASRILQGDLLCHLGQFSQAQIVYDELIHTTKDSIAQAEIKLKKANCLLAQAQTSTDKWEEASAWFERLYDYPQLPLAIKHEAGYKWGLCLEKQKNISQAQIVYWSMIQSIKWDAVADYSSSYWISRSILSLAQLLEDQKEPNQAQKLYELLIEHHMPGSRIAQKQLDNFSYAK